MKDGDGNLLPTGEGTLKENIEEIEQETDPERLRAMAISLARANADLERALDERAETAETLNGELWELLALLEGEADDRRARAVALRERLNETQPRMGFVKLEAWGEF